MKTPSNSKVSIHAWSEESLILFHYNELSADETIAIQKELKKSSKLQQQYNVIRELLNESLSKDIPKPSSNINQNIMAAVYREDAVSKVKAHTKFDKRKTTNSTSFFARLFALRIPKLASSFAVMTVVGISLFYVGRWSAIPEFDNSIVGNSSSSTSHVFTEQQRERILRASLNQHLDSGTRLLTTVSNGNGDLAHQIQQRSQFIRELISFNRMYRRIIENSGDKQLAHTLFQMESLLIEINNVTNGQSTNTDEIDKSLQQIQERLISSDLLFKLRVSEKRTKQKMI